MSKVLFSTKTKEICEKKKRYYTDEMAWVASYRYFLKFGDTLTPYLCPICREYHLTSHKSKIFPKWIEQKIINKEI